ncbi:uncharacterized protein KD926_011278 [Aspergillus affinis]|uniref:uncharacterized protein n=1 Tax=Aspergillus affinis TaxID=1070780 RepID=UPI0022FEF5A3|nr:uncharacterized protein KD926_011278 [Aspergillus affinis]KAI9038143.1 hypothetical protein KD926_011278 [Aspergillus affinis]
MATNTLDKPVRVNDLILVYNTKKRHMLVVKSVSDDQQISPPTSSVSVKKVNWHVPDLEDEDDDYCLCEKNSNNNPATRLDLFLYSMTSSDDTQNSQVNGRDVLEHYFKGRCPNCNGKGWFCPGCGPVSDLFPDIGGSCAVDQACPMCMGYNFALNDKAWIAEIEDIEARRFNWNDDGRELVDDDELERLRDEAVESTKERYEAINKRRQKMGMLPKDFDDLVEECRAGFDMN